MFIQAENMKQNVHDIRFPANPRSYFRFLFVLHPRLATSSYNILRDSESPRYMQYVMGFAGGSQEDFMYIIEITL
jgi:hypothetical protein